MVSRRPLSVVVLAVALVLAVATSAFASPPAPAPDPASSSEPVPDDVADLPPLPSDAVVVRHEDGIGVDLDPTVGPSAAVTAEAGGHTTARATLGGYAVLFDGVGIHRNYTVRMVTDHPDWDEIDEEVADAVAEIDYITGGNVQMGSTIGQHTTAPGQISVSVATTSPCGALNWFAAIGCGAAYWVDDRIEFGQVWICTCLTADAGVYGTIIHEFGHALGLMHYNPDYEGQVQVMFPTYAPGMIRFRSGDVNGLRKLTANGFGGGTAPKHPPSPTGTPTVNGSFGKVAVTWGAATAYGAAIDKHQIQVENMDTDGVKTVTVGSSRSGSVSVTGGADYRARVRAHNGLGWGDWSPWSTADFVEGRCIPAIIDVPESSPFCADITWLLDEGITAGYPDDTYRQGEPVTRQAMAAFLMRNAERLVPGSTDGEFTEPFSDVGANHLFRDEIAWLNASGITGGFPDGTYRPDADISRASMAAMLMRFTEYLWPDSTSGDWSATPFTDVPASHTFHDEITWLVSTGITTGFPGGVYRPGDDISRGGMAAFLHRHDTEFG